MDEWGLRTIFWGGAGLDGNYIDDFINKLQSSGINNVHRGLHASDGMIIDALKVNQLRLKNYAGLYFDFDPNNSCSLNEQNNYIGYSYGSLLAAQTAYYKASIRHCYIDNLVLIGSPIDSDFLDTLKNNQYIGKVIVINLNNFGDPIYAGMSESSLMMSVPILMYQQFSSGKDGKGHFYYAGSSMMAKRRRLMLSLYIQSLGLK